MRNHVVCLPVPAQSHVEAMLKLAKIIHNKASFFITFINTDFNHRRMLNSRGLAKEDIPGFRFLSITDGLPTLDANATQSLHALCDSCRTYMVQPFLDLMVKLDEEEDVPPVTHILSDGFMNFITSPAAEKFGVPLVHLFPFPACSLMAIKPYGLFLEKWLKPSKDEPDRTRGISSDNMIDWISGMKNMRLRNMLDFYGAKDDDKPLVCFTLDVMECTGKAMVTIVNTFEELEPVELDALSSIIPNVYAIGPLHMLLEQIPKDDSVLKHASGSLWEECVDILKWFDLKEPRTVLYVNFGSIAFLTYEQLVEFAMGLANSNHPFL